MKRAHGFTLIELMVVVGVIALLAAIAYPIYTSQIRKSRRAEARQVLADISLRQEKWRVDHSTYATCDALLSPATCASFNATKTYYDLSIAGNTATDYTLTATRKGDQVKDTACGNLVFTMDDGTITKSATGTSPADCW
jgi:type IV pilus assembly protein PilE